MKERVHKKLATVCLMIAMFFNPMGYDAIMKMLLDGGMSYWNVILLFYLLSAFFFGLFFFFSKTNPLRYIITKLKQVIRRHPQK
jgi:hypothetical protein